MLKKIRTGFIIFSITSSIMTMVFFMTGIVAMGSELGIINPDSLNLSMTGDRIVTSKGAQSVVDWARVIAEYMRDNGYYYPKDPNTGKLNPNLGHYDIRYNDGNSKHCCCATYVSWVLQEAGMIKGHTNATWIIDDWLFKDPNWDQTKVDNLKGFKKGDVLIFGTSHTDIYAGDGKFWDAGSDLSTDFKKRGAFKGYAKEINPFEDFRGFSYVYRYNGK